MPFAGYDDFNACVLDNQDKEDAEAYCSEIKRQVEGEAALSDSERDAADRSGCPEGEVNIGGRCTPVKEVDGIPQSSLTMSASRILANRRLAGAIEREELSDNRVKYRNVALLDQGVWTDAGSGQPTEYDPAELEVADEAAVNIMHDSESDASQAGHIDAESWTVENGTGYADVVLDLDTAAGEYADENLQEALESGGEVGFGGPSIEIPADGYDLQETGNGYPKLVNGVINGLGFVKDPASKTTSFQNQTAQRGVAMSDGQNPMVYTRQEGGMSDSETRERIMSEVLGRELQADNIEEDAQAIADELDVPVGDVMDVLNPLLDMDEPEEGEGDGEEEDAEMEDGEDGEEEDDDEQEMQDGEMVDERIDELWEELETIKEEMMGEQEMSALADADTVAELRDEKKALAERVDELTDEIEEREKRLSALEDEPKNPESLSDTGGSDDGDVEYAPISPSQSRGY